MSGGKPLVRLSIDAGIAEISFNRPERLNAISPGIAAALKTAVEEATSRDDVGVIVLSAQGNSWMAGGDLAYFKEAGDRRAAADQLVGIVTDALKRLSDAPQIVIASVKGAVAGGGMGIALCSDLVIAADDTTFSSAYARIAMSPDCGMSWMLPRLIGLRRSMEVVLLADKIDAQAALDLGLVNRVVPHASLEAETARIAERIAAGGFLANAHAKRLLRMSYEQDFKSQLSAEREGFVACAVSADFDEGIAAFLGKRKPAFSGKRSGGPLSSSSGG